MMRNKQKGYVYILTNPSFRNDWVKIGKSSRPVDVRSKELDNTSVPLPFEIFATMETVMYNEVEKMVHKIIDRLTDLRIRQNREFFNVDPEVALSIFYDIAPSVVDAKIVKYKDNKPLEIKKSLKDKDLKSSTPKKVSEKRKPFRFSMIDVKVGESITFIPTGVQVKVVSDKLIEYKGKNYSLSLFARTFMPEEHLQSYTGTIGGPVYFSYNGLPLHKIRLNKEKLKNND